MHFFKKTNLLLLTLFLFVVGAAYFFSLFDEYLDNERKYTEQTQKPYILQKLDYLSSFIIPSIEEQGDFDKLLEAEPTAALSNLSAITTTITQEALNSFTAPQEHPLPLLAHYNSGAVGVDEGMTPDYMISLIEEGNHILPSWRIEPSWKQELPDEYYQNSLLRAKELNLPLTFIIDPIESTLTNDSYYFTLSADQNPNVVDANGNILEKLSPLGPDALWSEIAQNFANSSLMQKIQQWYPNPPLVMFVDASSAKKLNWTELEDSQRYLNRYGNTTDDNFKRTVIGAQWIEKYRLLHEGIKNRFSADAWKTNTKFIAYNPISLNIGTTSDWEANATLTNQHFSSWPLTTDGMNEQYYTDASTSSLNNNIFNINNIPFVLAQAYKQNAGFSYQLSIADYDAFDTANKYRGFAQLGLWLTRPNIIREFNNNTNDRNLITPHFQSIIDSVELIHNDDRLQNFWKNGQLVVNPTASIEQLLNVPSYYESADKWFLLDVDINPQPEWTLDTHVPVYAIALQTGVPPDREWLLLVQSFDGDQNNVAVTIPNYQDVFVSASENGNLYVINENNNTIVSPVSQKDKTLSVLKAFPTAEGAAAKSIGGRGGRTIEVTNLNSDGPGSLREALEASGPRTIVFKVSGTIDITGEKRLVIKNPYVTIAGQTAPEGGITLKGYEIWIQTHDVIMRYIKIRTGYSSAFEENKQEGDNISINDGAYNVIIDHCSFSWSNDENAQIYSWKKLTKSVYDITYSWNIFSEGLSYNHASCGMIASSMSNSDTMTNIELHHNAFLHFNNRMPLLKVKSAKMINNLIYNWDWYATGLKGGMDIDIIGNKYKPGPNTPKNSLFHEIIIETDEGILERGGDLTDPAYGAFGTPSIYIKGNRGPNQPDETVDNWNMIGNWVDDGRSTQSGENINKEKYQRLTPLNNTEFPITIDDINKAETSILSDAGASKRLNSFGEWIVDRDSIDSRVINEYKTSSGKIPKYETDVGGYIRFTSKKGYLDSDHDGMPDDWENKYGLNINNASDSNDDENNNGYTNLEEFLNGTNPLN